MSSCRLTSADVIHSFWVPELGGKLDLLPDGVNTMVIEADEPGTYGGVCAEFCGLQHAKMRFLVVAQPRGGLRRLAGGPATAGRRAGRPKRPSVGRDVFEQHGCAGCHAVREATDRRGARSDVAGPDLTHVASRATLAAGTVENTTPTSTSFLGDPDAVKDGTSMPTAELSDAELADLVAYVESLE